MYGTPVSKTGLQVLESGHGKFRTTKFVFNAMEVTMVDEAGVVAYGSQKLIDFLPGVVEVLGSRGSLSRVERTAAGFNVDFDGDWSVGTVAASNNGTLASTEQNLVPTTATAQAAAGISAGSAAVATTRCGTIDGHSSAMDIYLNLLVDDADHDITTTPSNLKVWGEVEVHWVDVGDDAAVA